MNQITQTLKKNIKAQREKITSSSERISVSEKSSQELTAAFSEEQGSASICCCGWEELSRACKYQNKNNKTIITSTVKTQNLILYKWYIGDVKRNLKQYEQNKRTKMKEMKDEKRATIWTW